MADNSTKNKDQGRFFEELFLKQAQRTGFLAIKNPPGCRIIYGGRLKLVFNDLDYKISKNGKTAFLDCKTYGEDHFVYSQIEEKQLERAVLYNDFKVPSGFVVYFRLSNQIVFYKGHVIAEKGPGTRFVPEDGVALGQFELFSLGPVFGGRAYSKGLA
jgi:hypothetical protein